MSFPSILKLFIRNPARLPYLPVADERVKSCRVAAEVASLGIRWLAPDAVTPS